MNRESAEENILLFTNSEVAFEQVFKENFKALLMYAYTFIKDQAVAEDIVQTTFLKLWEKSSELQIHSSVRAYLYRSVYHECLNHLKHQNIRATHEAHLKNTMEVHKENTLAKMQLQELQKKLSEALVMLPEGCRTVFQMSRFESLKYREIAEKLNISVKTVENQMGKALKILREQLIDYLPTVFLIIFILTNS